MKKPYVLTRKFLILELSNEFGDIIGDIYFNLHNFFCGPKHYIQKWEGMDGEVLLKLRKID